MKHEQGLVAGNEDVSAGGQSATKHVIILRVTHGPYQNRVAPERGCPQKIAGDGDPGVRPVNPGFKGLDQPGLDLARNGHLQRRFQGFAKRRLRHTARHERRNMYASVRNGDCHSLSLARRRAHCGRHGSGQQQSQPRPACHRCTLCRPSCRAAASFVPAVPSSLRDQTNRHRSGFTDLEPTLVPLWLRPAASSVRKLTRTVQARRAGQRARSSGRALPSGPLRSIPAALGPTAPAFGRRKLTERRLTGAWVRSLNPVSGFSPKRTCSRCRRDRSKPFHRSVATDDPHGKDSPRRRLAPALRT
jgi:hypothetical protein